MKCPEAKGLMTQALYEPLVPTTEGRLRTHLGSCSACAEEWKGMQLLEGRLREMAAAERAAPAVPLVDRWRHARTAAPMVLPLKPALAGGGVALAVVAGVMMLRDGAPWKTGHVAPQQGLQAHPRLNGPAPTSGDRDSVRPLPKTARQSQEPSVPQPPRQTAPPLANASPRPAARVATVADTGREDRPQPQSVPGSKPILRSKPAVADETWLDGRDSRLAARWFTGSEEDPELRKLLDSALPHLRDDFVEVPLPRIAAAEVNNGAVRTAVQQYQKEASVVDPRLFGKVTLRLKGGSLEELCGQLKEQTTVRLSAARGVRDEKITVFVKDQPARDVMRAVARLLSYKWARSGEEGSYRYELTQDLREQLAEQEMRNRDLNAALVALDEKVGAARQIAGLTPDQIRERLKTVKGPERDLIQRTAGMGWGAFQVFFRLTPGELASLGGGQKLRFSTNQAHADRRLPDEWRVPLIQAWGDQALGVDPSDGRLRAGQYQSLKDQGFNPVRWVDIPGSSAGVELRVDRSELGQVSLNAETTIFASYRGSEPGFGTPQVLATAQSPSVARPDNAAANRSLKLHAPFNANVSLKPSSSCPVHRAAAEARKAGKPEADPQVLPGVIDVGDFHRRQRDERLAQPHVTTADVWEAVHETTRLPIIADYYTRLYPLEKVTVQKATLFDALNQVADELRIRWRKDDAFILGRSTSFFWDKLKEVPNRHLNKWEASKQRAGGLPAADLLEMALLTDAQLDSAVVADGLTHCRGLAEWSLLGEVQGGYSARPWLRVLAEMNEAKRRQAFSAEGLPLAALTPAELQAVIAVGISTGQSSAEDPRLVAQRRLRVDYAPEGWFAWIPILGPQRPQDSARYLPHLAAPTHAEVLAAARRIDPNLRSEEVARSRGVLYLTMRAADGREWPVAGDRPIRAQGPQQ